MGGRIDTILMWVKFGDDPIGSLDFSFIGGVPLIKNITTAAVKTHLEASVKHLFRAKRRLFSVKSTTHVRSNCI